MSVHNPVYRALIEWRQEENLEDLSDKLDSIDDDDDDDDSFDLGDLSVLSGLGDLGKLAKAFGGKIVDGTDTIETKEGKTILK